MGFERRYIFHSFRKTVVTQLEQAGISENLIADIVGHHKPRITYGLYRSGSSLEQKLKEINSIKYYESIIYSYYLNKKIDILRNIKDFSI